jgi:alpha-2-macroglobulin
VNGKSIGTGSVDKSNVDQTKTLTVAIRDLVQNAANDLVISRDATTGRLYYSAFLNYYLPAENIPALNKGIVVARQYEAVDPQTLKPTGKIIQSATVGDYVQVTLTLIAPTDLNYLVLEDPLPAGFEAVDTTLKTASAAAESPQLQKQPPPGQNQENVFSRFYEPYWTYWAHSEIRDDRVAVFATYLGRGTYEYSYMMRASVGGAFRALPARAWEMYFPDVFGRSAGAVFTVAGQ